MSSERHKKIGLCTLLNVCRLIFMGRIDQVEYVGVSQQGNGNVRNILEGDVNVIKRQLDIA